MILLVCGPSGGGKTTLIQELSQIHNFRIKKITVHRSISRQSSDIAKNEVSFDMLEKTKFSFKFLYSFEESIYGFSVDDEEDNSPFYYLLDYPGEYPLCSELHEMNWQGILVLPPSLSILKNRLNKEGRSFRIKGSIKEYKDCLNEIELGFYKSPRWSIYVSKNNKALKQYRRFCEKFYM